MDNRFKKWLTGLLLRLAVYVPAMGLPVLFKYLLAAAVPLYLLIILAAVKLILVEIGLVTKYKVLHYTGRVLSTLFSALFGVTLLLTVIITPLSAYVYFFAAISQFAGEELYVASIFTLIITFFTLFFCTAALKNRSCKPLSGILIILSGILLIIFQNPVLLPVFLACLALYIFLVMQSRVLPLVTGIVLCCGISLIFYVVNSKPGGSELVDNYLHPEIRQAINNYFPGFPLLMDIPGYGLGHGSARLGGSSMLTATPVLEIKSDKSETIYLQTSTYDVYTGKNWQQSKLFLAELKPAAREAWLKENVKSRQLDIKILTEAFSTIPLTYDTIAVQYNNQLYPVDRQERWQGIESKDVLKKSQTIRLYRAPVQPAANENSEDPDKYLQVPDFLPEAVITLARGFAGDGAAPGEILRRIQDYLSENYTYDLQASVVKEKEDFVAKFLFNDKRGYCTHFASAFVILARLNNIPARYTTGYLVYIAGGKTPKVVTARSAHAWPEILLPGQGWVSWEATSVVNVDYYSRYAYEFYQYYLEGNDIARNLLTLRQLQELLGIKLKFRQEEKKAQGIAFTIDPGVLYRIAAFIFICGLLVAGIMLTIGLVSYDLKKKLCRSIKQIVKVYKKVPLPECTGWVQWQQNLVKAYGIDPVQAARLLAVVLKIAYSSKSAEKEELIFLKAFRKRSFQAALARGFTGFPFSRSS